VPCRALPYVEALEAIRRGDVGVLINVPTAGHDPRRWGFRLRRAAVERRIPCLTTLETAQVYGEVLAALREGALVAPQPMAGPAPLA
jgi:carbamoyl-phosphate synthase large subunit